MAQKPVELILAKQLASHLTLPIILLGAEGDLLFVNEPAEEMLGFRFDEVGELPFSEWSDSFVVIGADGERVSREERPLLKALSERVPSHADVVLRAMTGEDQSVSITAVPLVSQSGGYLGAIGLIWEPDQ